MSSVLPPFSTMVNLYLLLLLFMTFQSLLTNSEFGVLGTIIGAYSKINVVNQKGGWGQDFMKTNFLISFFGQIEYNMDSIFYKLYRFGIELSSSVSISVSVCLCVQKFKKMDTD